MKHQAAFEEFSNGFEASRPAELVEWKEKVLVWEAIPHPKTSDSAFELAEEVTTLQQIQLEIAAEEFILTEEGGVEIQQEHSAGGLITMGMELEETQFRQIQAVYMPALCVLLSPAQQEVYDDNGDQLPKAMRLFMRLELVTNSIRAKACAMGMAELEACMRLGEASEVLEAVHHGLHTRTMTNRYKLRSYTGRGMMMKGQGILHHINIKIHATKGHGGWEEQLRVLDDDDMRALNEGALTTEEKAQHDQWAKLRGTFAEGGVVHAEALAAGESHSLSWIALWLEWSKAYTRSKRYMEDVWLFREEMHRTVAYGYTAATSWEELACTEMPDSEPEVTEGQRAHIFGGDGWSRDGCSGDGQNGGGEESDPEEEARLEAGEVE
ncbi:hypothetical protein K438DRAFT_1778535 [Mycena galopus ATCC 62051]|nr:hypothetical protein K438DRAFT_1778535 [Mycena galopus ATCC 62051]